MSVFTSVVAAGRQPQQTPGEIIQDYISKNPDEVHKGLLGGDYQTTLSISTELHERINEEQVNKHVRNLTRKMQNTLREATKRLEHNKRLEIETPIHDLRNLKRQYMKDSETYASLELQHNNAASRIKIIKNEIEELKHRTAYLHTVWNPRIQNLELQIKKLSTQVKRKESQDVDTTAQREELLKINDDIENVKRNIETFRKNQAKLQSEMAKAKEERENEKQLQMQREREKQEKALEERRKQINMAQEKNKTESKKPEKKLTVVPPDDKRPFQSGDPDDSQFNLTNQDMRNDQIRTAYQKMTDIRESYRRKKRLITRQEKEFDDIIKACERNEAILAGLNKERVLLRERESMYNKQIAKAEKKIKKEFSGDEDLLWKCAKSRYDDICEMFQKCTPYVNIINDLSNSLESELKCSLCHHIASDPHLMWKSGDTVCESCGFEACVNEEKLFTDQHGIVRERILHTPNIHASFIMSRYDAVGVNLKNLQVQYEKTKEMLPAAQKKIHDLCYDLDNVSVNT